MLKKFFTAINAKKIFRFENQFLGLKNEFDQKKGQQKNLRGNEVEYRSFTNFRKFRG